MATRARARARPPSLQRRTVAAHCLATLLLISSSALADPLSTFGFGARAESLAGALTADATGHVAAFYNPAGVARATEVEASVGYSYGVMQLRLDGRDAEVTTPRGVSLGLSVPLTLGPLRLGFGVALHVPDQFIARIQAVPAAEPHFVLLGNGPERIVIAPVLALRPWPWLSIGAGATLLADAAGHGIDFDVGLVAGEKVSRGALDVSLPIRAAPVAGIVVEPSQRLRLGLAYRGPIDLAVRIDILAHVDIAGAVQGTTGITLRAASYYTPRRVALGAAFDMSPSLTAHAELAWLGWSAFDGALADLRIAIALGVVPPLVAPSLEAARFSDIWVPRAGLEYRGHASSHVAVAGRIGLSFERSPVPDQVGLTSLADNDRVLVTGGAGVELDGLIPALERPLRIDAALGWHELLERTAIKDPRIFPGRDFSSSGRMIHLSVTMEARF